MNRDLSWLKDSFKALDRVYFGDSVSGQGFKVKWMRWRPNKKSFIFGRCYKETKTVEINRALQHSWVPDYVVLSALYHEMLHVVLDDYSNDHAMTFKLAEEKFVSFRQSEIWESENINKLIKCDRPQSVLKDEKEELDSDTV